MRGEYIQYTLHVRSVYVRMLLLQNRVLVVVVVVAVVDVIVQVRCANRGEVHWGWCSIRSDALNGECLV